MSIFVLGFTILNQEIRQGPRPAKLQPQTEHLAVTKTSIWKVQ